MNRTCFVIMPIGDQRLGDSIVTAADLRQRYADLIKEALLKADPSLEVVRADDVPMPGSISSDILARLMRSDLVVADVTYPNPNVFYELGLRHACRAGTIILRDKAAPTVPFDIAHLRHIEYENTTSGLRELAADLRQAIQAIDSNPGRPDNQFLELAKITDYRFPDFGSQERAVESAQEEMLDAVFHTPQLMEVLLRQTATGEKADQAEVVRAMASNPDAMSSVFRAMMRSGQISFNTPPTTAPAEPPANAEPAPTKSPAKNRAARRHPPK